MTTDSPSNIPPSTAAPRSLVPSSKATRGSHSLHAPCNKATAGPCSFSLLPAFSAVCRVKIYSIA